ncbi:uncharacterized protein BYT42DRAFT_494046 [Radiomyces spectabilis]|uniref:uncharacterized protein n=1 Tax=Radiomyces spectabilis TaxID=64574 RepID=UPI0022207B19|nr:uncharacterized protein BYT42DRAFT_494046 [Radiomyces spectabilis]KAI8381172.1 hypothetical protein BYT42DRAFT_494046 [Radiomyces spectabilis]
MKKSSHGTSTHAYDQKNIRRRVYDALNVLMAMGIIAKDKKEIKWLGVPACYQGDQAHNKNKNADLLQQIEQEERRQAELESMVDRTRMQIRGKLTRHLQVCDLIHRNQQQPTTDDSVIFLPFFAVESDQNTLIDKTQDGKSAIVSIEADVERAIYEDTDVLHHLSFGKSITPELATCLPDPAWQQFLTDRTSVNVA